MSAGFKAVIFDFDGVVLDSARLKTEAFALCYGGEPSEAIDAIIAYQEQHGGISRRVKFEYFEREIFGRQSSPATIDALCRTFSEIIRVKMLTVDPVPGALETLADLSRDRPLHLVSGMPEEELLAVLAERDLAGFFTSIAGAPKTKREEFRRILTDEGMQPNDVLAVGDSMTEYEAAVELGIPFLAIVASGAPDFFPADVMRRRDLVDFRQAMKLLAAGTNFP